MKHKTKVSLTSAAFAVVSVAVIVAVNMVVSSLAKKTNLEFDMTPNKIYNLTDTTLDFLKSYDRDTTIYTFASSADEDSVIANVLRKYQAASEHIKLENINPAENPTFGKEYVKQGESLQQDSVIIDGGSGRYRVYTLSELYSINESTGTVRGVDAENKITSALRYIKSDEESTAYFMTGHNEANADGAKTHLESEGYIVEELNILNADIPEEAKLIIIAAPSADFTPEEIVKLEAYFARGGSAFVMFDASTRAELPNLSAELAQWGIAVSDSVSVEEDTDHLLMISGSGQTICVPELADHAVTSAVKDNDRTVAYLPYARTLEKLFDTNTSYKTSVLMTTTKKSHTAFDYDNLEAADNSDGSYPIMIASEDSKTGAKIVVSGSTFLCSVAKETVADRLGLANYDLVSNICSYLQGSEANTISAKSLAASRLTMSSAAVLLTALWLAVIPLAILGAGIVVRHKRKNL